MPEPTELGVVADPFHVEPDATAPLEEPTAPAAQGEENPAPETLPAPDANRDEYVPRERRV